MKLNAPKKFTLIGCVLAVAGVSVAQTAYSNFAQAIAAANAQISAGEYESAQKTAQQALDLAKTPSDKVGALVRLGLSYSQRKLYDQAREQWGKALRLPEVSPQERLAVQSAIATSYGEQQNWERSRAEFEKIVADPAATANDKAVARMAIASTFSAQESEEQARNVFAIVADDPALTANTRAFAYLQIADSFVQQRQWEQARASLVKALTLRGIASELALSAQAQIARTYQAQGDGVRAQQEFLRAQGIAINQFNAQFKAKEFAAAHKTLELFFTLGEVSPLSDAAARMQRGYLLQAEGKPAQARESFESVRKKQFEAGLSETSKVALRAIGQSAQFGIAKTYVQEQNKVEAQKTLVDLLQQKPLEPGVQAGAQKLLKSFS